MRIRFWYRDNPAAPNAAASACAFYSDDVTDTEDLPVAAAATAATDFLSILNN